MSNTEYARPYALRLTKEERHVLARMLMVEIEEVSHDDESLSEKMSGHLRMLRSLHERLMD